MKPARPQQKIGATIRFKEVLTRDLLALPKSAGAKLKIPSRGTTAVEGIINAFPFQSTLTSDGKGIQTLKISRAMYDAASKGDGDTVTIEITKVGDEIETRVPADLRKAISAVPRARDVWADITPIARRDWIFWLISAKQEKTRAVRIKKACNMLARGKRRVCCFGGIQWLIKTAWDS